MYSGGSIRRVLLPVGYRAVHSSGLDHQPADRHLDPDLPSAEQSTMPRSVVRTARTSSVLRD